MNDERIFPRYNAVQLKAIITIPSLETIRLYVKDISLNGIQVYSENKIILRNFNTVQFRINEDRIFQLNISQVWQEEFSLEENDLIHFRSGFRLKFSNANSFQKWRTFLFAIHKLNVQKSKIND